VTNPNTTAMSATEKILKKVHFIYGLTILLPVLGLDLVASVLRFPYLTMSAKLEQLEQGRRDRAKARNERRAESYARYERRHA
jgi:hypothetical protein